MYIFWAVLNFLFVCLVVVNAQREYMRETLQLPTEN